jgi:uncharacterized membrane protein
VSRSKHAKPVRRREFIDRPRVSVLMVVLDLATLAITAGHVHGSVRFVLGLAFGLLVPGWSLIGWLKLRNAALEFAMTVGTSLALLTVVAQVLVTVHEWRLFSLQIVVCLVCLPSLVGQARGFRQSKN